MKRTREHSDPKTAGHSAAGGDNPDAKRRREASTKYQKKSLLEQINARPAMYVGATKPIEQTARVLDETWKHGLRIVPEVGEFSDAFINTFNEIITNAADNISRTHRNPKTSNKTTIVRVNFDVFEKPEGKQGLRITVWNNGQAIELCEHEEHKPLWVPELIFGSLLTSSNYDDDQKRLEGGCNGYGAKLTNIFSNEFTVSVQNSEFKKRYSQTWRDGMTVKEPRKVINLKMCMSSGDYTCVEYEPNLDRFETTTDLRNNIALRIMRRQVVDLAATQPKVSVYLDDKLIPITKRTQYVHLCDRSRTYRQGELPMVPIPITPLSATSGRKRRVIGGGKGDKYALRKVPGLKVHDVWSKDKHWNVLLAYYNPPSETPPNQDNDGEGNEDGDNNNDNDGDDENDGNVGDGLDEANVDGNGDNAQTDVQTDAQTEAQPDADMSDMGPVPEVEAFMEPAVPVSFVNSINTEKNGTHVSHAQTRVGNALIRILKTKRGGKDIKPSMLWKTVDMFVWCSVVRPVFDAQIKAELRSPIAEFGTVCAPQEAHIAKVAKDATLARRLQGESIDTSLLNKTDGVKARTLTGIPKLDDANDAGTKLSGDCSLLLMEGDSAAALARNGLFPVLGRDKYGVFPLRGKPINTRETAAEDLAKNTEYCNIKRILGLREDCSYETEEELATLRYGKVWLFADQDVDGSHIVGLIMNMFDNAKWRNLLYKWDFFYRVVTPIVKAIPNRTAKKLDTHKIFFTIAEYHQWEKEAEANGTINQYTAKYYKGLGTSSNAEGRHYFENLSKHLVKMTFAEPSDPERMDIVFNKKRATDRKRWIVGETKRLEDNTDAYTGAMRDGKMSLESFINTEMTTFSLYNIARMLPGPDGLKATVRKIVWYLLTILNDPNKEIKIGSLAGQIIDKLKYHHGEAAMQGTLVGNGQDYMGSNNVPLLQGLGQFGSRAENGKDHAQARYISTAVSKSCLKLFPKDDLPVLEPQEDEGHQIEPANLHPIVNVALLNGITGVGSGWSSDMPPYNPVDVCEAYRLWIEGGDEKARTKELTPWFRGFKGKVIPSNSARTNFILHGIMEVVDSNTWDVLELAPKIATQKFKEFLENTIVVPGYAELLELHGEDAVHFRILWKRGQLKAFEAILEASKSKRAKKCLCSQEALAKVKCPNVYTLLYNRTCGSVSLTNQCSVSEDKEVVVRKHSTPHELISHHAPARLEVYKKRLAHQISEAEAKKIEIGVRLRFLIAVAEERSLVVVDRKAQDIKNDMLKMGFPEDMLDTLVKMPIYSLNTDTLARYKKDMDEKEKMIATLKATTPAQLWLADLDDFEKTYLEFEKHYANSIAPALDSGSAKRKAPKKSKSSRAPKRARTKKEQ